MHSLDMVNENIKKIGNLFPECVTETVDENGNVKAAIDFEKLQENLSHATIGEGEERYQFTWPGKREAIHNANAPTNMTLRPCKEESVDFDNTENLYIEGDNLEVLKLLQENYLGKVKMIYIDPPYNTGNDFVYNDDFKEDTESFQSKSGMYDEDGNMLLQNFEKNTESNGRFHTDWLNMMYPRLKIARNLLSDDGVIFISIDDHEVVNLRKVCDELFGQDQFVTNFVWLKGKEGGNDSSIMRSHYESIVCYCKNSSNISIINLDPKDTSRHITKDREKNLVAGIESFPNEGELFQLVNLSKQKDYTVEIPLVDGTIIRWPSYAPQSSIDKWIKIGKIFVGEKKVPYVKSYLKDELQGQKPSNIITQEYGTTKAGSIEIREFFGNREIFSYPKPSVLIQRLIQIGARKDSLILDFFSGSGSSAQAVMKLNSLDNGSRKFILVQLPEMTENDSEARKAGFGNICEIAKQRIKLASKRITNECGSGGSKKDIGFRVLKLADSNMKDVYYSPAETTSPDLFDPNNVKEDRTPLDLLFQVMPECNLPLSSKIEERSIEGKTVYFVNGNYLVACFDEGITEKLIKSVIDVPDSDKPYYFYMRNLGLESDKVLDNFEQLFVHYSPTTKRKVI